MLSVQLLALSPFVFATAAELPLLEAARSDDAERVAALLKTHADVNVRQADGATALHWAAHHDDLRLASMLVRAGAKASVADDTGATPLFVACMNRSSPMVSLLLDAGADANAALMTGETALMTCARTGDAAAVRALVAHGADPNLRMTKGTPMRRDTTDWNLPKSLIGSTPYLLAAKFLEPAILPVLAAAGADARATMPDGADALMLATGMGSSRTASRRGIEVIDFGKVEPESRVRETVAAVIGLGARLDAASRSGDTALHVAAALGYDTVVQLLVDRGAAVSVKNARGLTPLAAAMFGSTAGARGAAAPAGADSLGFEPPIQLAHPTTVALLKELGAR